MEISLPLFGTQLSSEVHTALAINHAIGCLNPPAVQTDRDPPPDQGRELLLALRSHARMQVTAPPRAAVLTIAPAFRAALWPKNQACMHWPLSMCRRTLFARR